MMVSYELSETLFKIRSSVHLCHHHVGNIALPLLTCLCNFVGNELDRHEWEYFETVLFHSNLYIQHDSNAGLS
jgi:hypothetical protein